MIESISICSVHATTTPTHPLNTNPPPPGLVATYLWLGAVLGSADFLKSSGPN